MKIFFALAPSILVFSVISILTGDVILASIFSAAMFGLGMQVLKAKPERGEFRR